ncbi:MAG: hypothetical protein SFT94_10005 [Pseudanabaenaceae cyanobacterium bins.68]|nr:hypothetical protein [Pseudanabaenaceae cyanobacterium bins.68]
MKIYPKNPRTGKSSGYLTKIGMDNYAGSHAESYAEFVQQLHQT